MFEIYREGDYNRRYRSVLYTELEEHGRDAEIARAAAGETVFSGFLADEHREAARAEIDRILEELNDLGEDDDEPSREAIEQRLARYLVD